MRPYVWQLPYRLAQKNMPVAYFYLLDKNVHDQLGRTEFRPAPVLFQSKLSSNDKNQKQLTK